MFQSKKLIIVFLSFFSIVCLANSVEQYPFKDPKQQQQFQSLLKELRCLVCQNQDLADSNASLAQDLKQVVYQKVLAHQSDLEIKAFLTKRYGDFVLFKPPFKLQTLLLWFGPFVMLVLGFVVLYRYVKRMQITHD